LFDTSGVTVAGAQSGVFNAVRQRSTSNWTLRVPAELSRLAMGILLLVARRDTTVVALSPHGNIPAIASATRGVVRCLHAL
jgi:hypothetical protein